MRRSAFLIFVFLFVAASSVAALFFLFDDSGGVDRLDGIPSIDADAAERGVMRDGGVVRTNAGEPDDSLNAPAESMPTPTFRLSARTDAGRPVKVLGVRPLPHGPGLHKKSDAPDDEFAVSLPVRHVGEEVKVDLDGMPTQRVTLAPSGDRQEIVLSAKIEVTGQVWVKGNIPSRVLTVECFDLSERRAFKNQTQRITGIHVPKGVKELTLPPGLLPGVGTAPDPSKKTPEPALKDEVDLVFRADPAVTMTNAEGRFRLAGFSPGQRLVIVVKDGELELTVAMKKDEIETIVEAPATNIIIEIDVRPSVVGKLTYDGDTRPGSAICAFHDQVTGRLIEVNRSIIVGRDGGFRMSTEVYAEQRIGYLEFGDHEARFIMPKAFYGELDIGSPLMTSIPIYEVTVSDVAGQPIDGARLTWNSERDGRMTMTDANGKVRVKGGLDMDELTVEGFGKLKKVVRVPKTSGPLSVILDSAPILVAEIVGKSERLPAGLSCRIRCDGARAQVVAGGLSYLNVSFHPFYADSRGDVRRFERSNEIRAFASRTIPGSFEFSLLGDAAYSIEGLSEGQAVTLEVFAGKGGKTLLTEIVAVERGQANNVKLVVDIVPRFVTGTVVDAEGRPVGEIPVSVAEDSRSPSLGTATTGTDGRFRIGPILPERVKLTIRGGPGRLVTEDVEPNEKDDYSPYALPR